MSGHGYRFVEEYEGPVAFGLEPEADKATITWYLQKFADDAHMALIRERMSQSDMTALFDFLGGLLKKYLSEKEYHEVFLKDEG